MLYLQLRDARNYEEWRNSPVPLTHDEDVAHTPKTVEDCLQAIFLYIREDHGSIDKNHDYLEELEAEMLKDHEKVLAHEKQIDRNFRIIVRLKILLAKLKSEKKNYAEVAKMKSDQNDDTNITKMEITEEENPKHYTLQEISNVAGAPAMAFNEKTGKFEYVMPREEKENVPNK